MNGSIRWRLSVMMVLIYAIQGSFWPLLAVHLADLGIEGRGRGWIFATFALGSLAMPLGAGSLVDRLMPTQRYLALIYALATGILAILALGVFSHVWSLYALFLIYWLLTAPGYGLSTSLAMRHLSRPDEEFGRVRLWGTVGWMMAGWLVSGVMAVSGTAHSGRGMFEAFWVAAGLAMAFAAYSLTLPSTPPLAVGHRAGSGWRDGVDLFSQPGVGIFLLTSFGVSLTTPYAFQVVPTYLQARGVPREWISTTMTLSQLPEIAVLAGIPLVLRRIGYKGTLALGILAWAVRYAMLTASPPLWVVLTSLALHGAATALFQIAGLMYMDSRAPMHRRAGAQALLMVVTSGMGSLLGSLLAGEVVGRSEGDYELVFLVPCAINAVLFVMFCARFRSSADPLDGINPAGALRDPSAEAPRRASGGLGQLVTDPAEG